MGLGLGPLEMVMIFLVVLLLFGAKRLPEIGSSLGKGIREFKSSVSDIKKEISTEDESESRRLSREANAAPVQSGSGSDDEDDDGEPRRLTTSG